MNDREPSDQEFSEGHSSPSGPTDDVESSAPGAPSGASDEPGSPEEWEDTGNESESSGCVNALIGCSVAAGILVVVVAIALYLGWGYLSSMAVNQVTKMVEQSIEQSDLTEEQKKKLNKRIQQLKTRFQNGDLSTQEIQEIVKKSQPLIQASTVQSVKQVHIPNTDWSDQKKSDARRAIDRFTRGLMEGDIDRNAYQSVMEPLLASSTENQYQLKQEPKDEELNTFVQRARDQADQQDVPDASYDFDVASEFDRIVNETLNGGTSGSSAN